MVSPAPHIARSHQLTFIGDWGQANFHRICSWLAQEFCDRSGPRSRVSILNVRNGGREALDDVQDGVADLCIVTPAMLMPQALTGQGLFAGAPLPNLRCLAVLPQNDRMVFAINPALGLSTFEELRAARIPLRIATSTNDGTNFIGHVAGRFLDAHGLGEAAVQSWGGAHHTAHRPDPTLAMFQRGEVDAVLQEAIMTPWWYELIDTGRAKLVAPEPAALQRLVDEDGFARKVLPAGFWDAQTEDYDTIDFSDFLIVVRDDMADEVASLLTWALVETRETIERQYRHLPPHRSPLSYPLDPQAMARTSLPLHPAAAHYYRAQGYLGNR